KSGPIEIQHQFATQGVQPQFVVKIERITLKGSGGLRYGVQHRIYCTNARTNIRQTAIIRNFFVTIACKLQYEGVAFGSCLLNPKSIIMALVRFNKRSVLIKDSIRAI